MGETKIEWCDFSFNPWWGCSKVSPGCDHCYAEMWANRTGHTGLWGTRRFRTFGSAHWAEPLRWNDRAVAQGIRPRVFCASMADVFDNQAPIAERERLWELIERTPQLSWLLLTKRIGNAARMLPPGWIEQPQPNVWLGASIVDMAEAARDIPKLLATPARVRFLSCEPLLEPLDLSVWLWGLDEPCEQCPKDIDCECSWKTRRELGRPALDWVIVGGESGAHARPMEPQWAYALADQCKHAAVAMFMKQGSQANWPDFKNYAKFPLELQVRQWP